MKSNIAKSKAAQKGESNVVTKWEEIKWPTANFVFICFENEWPQ